MSLVLVGTGYAGHDKNVTDVNNGFGPNNRPAFLYVSVTERFDIPIVDRVNGALRANADKLGSPLVLVNVGTYVAGDSIETTRFVGLSPISIDLTDVPDDPETGLPPEFDGNQFTIVGSFRTLDPDSKVHMTTPYPGFIAPQVQQAYFNASVFFDDPDALPAFPTTVELALFVYDHQGGAGATMQEILDGIFGVDGVATASAQGDFSQALLPAPSPTLELVCSSPCESEGEIFPHDPEEDGLFTFHSLFDPVAGIVSLDICLPVSIDVKPGSSQNTVNAGSEGLLPIAVLTAAGFDPVIELDPSTVTAVLLDDHGEVLNSVPALWWTVHDVDGDGDRDVVFKFSVPDLVEGTLAPLTEFSLTVDFRGETYAAMCVEGNAAVRIVPAQK